MTERTRRNVSVNECCIVCQHGSLDGTITEDTECDIPNEAGEYEQHNYTHWCNKFDVDRFLQEDI